MSSDRVVKYSQPTYASRPDSMMTCTGEVVYRSAHLRNTFHRVALDNQGHSSRYFLEVPIVDIPTLIDILQAFSTG